MPNGVALDDLAHERSRGTRREKGGRGKKEAHSKKGAVEERWRTGNFNWHARSCASTVRAHTVGVKLWGVPGMREVGIV